MNAAENEMTADATEPHRDNINHGSHSPDWAARNATKYEPGTARERHRTRITDQDRVNGAGQHTPAPTRNDHWTWPAVDRKSS